ncbi:MAG: tetratricopeptide repeat protein [Candidatus Heimdallarchaeota archaeon]
MLQKESSILKEIDMLLTKGNYNEGLKIINENITKSTKETPFQIELLLRKSKTHFYTSNYSASLTSANESLKLSKKINDSLLIIDSFQILGEVYSELGHTDKVSSTIKQIEKQLDKIQEKTSIAEQRRRAEYCKLSGLLHIRKYEINKAIESYQKSLVFFNQQDNKEKIAEVSSRLGHVFFSKGDKESGSIIFDAIDIQKKIGNREALSASYLVLCDSFLRNSELKQVSLYLDKTFELLKNSESKYLLGQAYNYRGLVYYLDGDFNFALEFLNKSLDFFKIIDNKGLIGSLISNIGLIQSLRGDLDLSLDSFNQSLRIFEELGIQQNVAYHFGKLGSVYAQKGDYDLALVYLYKALKIMKQLKVAPSIAKTIFTIISVSIYDDDLDNAKQYLKQLQEVNKDKSHKKIDWWTRTAEALVLKSQKNEQDIDQAFSLLKQIAEEEIIDIETYSSVLLNICDILLDQLRKENKEAFLTEIRKYLNQLYEMASKQDSFWLIAQANWLLAYLALIELDTIKAQHMFTQAQKIAEERGFKRLAMSISNEFDKMLRKSSGFESCKHQDLSLADRVERSGFETVIKKIKQNIIDDEDLPIEKPVMLYISNSKGKPIFLQIFSSDKSKFSDVVIDEFMLAIKDLIDETSKEKKPIQRILYRELLVILKSFDDVSFCYVFDGQSYTAIERLEVIIASLQKQSAPLWNKILEQSKKGESVDQLTERNLVLFVNNLFTSNNLNQ